MHFLIINYENDKKPGFLLFGVRKLCFRCQSGALALRIVENFTTLEIKVYKKYVLLPVLCWGRVLHNLASN
jgi:hypothetical protein